MEKMSIAEQSAIRAEMYGDIEAMLNEKGYSTEPFKGGMLVALKDGHFAKINVAIANPEKFDIDTVRREYAEAMLAKEARAVAAAQRKAEHAEKLRNKAEAAAERAAE